MAVIKIVPMPGAVGDKGDEGAPGSVGPQGERGLQGTPGTNAVWSYQGAYNSAAAYSVGDVVVYQGQLYYTKSVTTAGTLPTDTAKFDLIASKGADGQAGSNGTNGINGTNGADGAPGAGFGIFYLGNYNPSSGYVPDIAVVRGSDGQLYLAKASGQLGDPVGNTAQWEVWIPKGADGTNGTNGINGADALWNYTGEYSGGAPYAVGDIATYDGQLWYRIGANGGNVGDTPSPGFWNLLAAKGADFDSTNGLVVTGYIDDPAVNPAGTMSLAVLDGGYTALMDLIASAATFNGNVYVTNLGDNKTTIIETPTTVNNQVTIQTEYGEGWTFDNNGYILGPWLSPAEDPGNSGRYLRVNGITRADNNPLLVSSSGPVLINGTGGEFLNDHGDPNNQIATIGDLPTGWTGTINANSPVLISVVNGIITEVNSLT
jgi:hypothetical protein